MPTSFSKISRIKSVSMGSKKKSEPSIHPNTNTTSTYQPSPEPSKSNMLPINPIVPKTTAEDSFFFNDQKCQHRALFMVSRLKQSLDHPLRPRSSYGELRDPTSTIVPTSSLSTPAKPVSVDSFWRTVTHRLYTLNYILFVLPSHSHSRAEFLNRLEAELSQKSDGQELQRRGGMESHFAIRYALEHKRPKRRKTLLEDAFEAEKRSGGNVAGAILPSTCSDETAKNDQYVEKARKVIETCLINESALSNAEKDAVYVEESRLAGLYDSFELRIELEEDRTLRHRLKRMVDQQRNYKNPFEDQDLIVLDDVEDKSSREVDSGFYEGWPNPQASVNV